MLTITVVAVFYFHALTLSSNTVAGLPKIAPGVQRATESFTLSKSEGGHTLFTVRAEHATQFMQGGRAELKDVSIVVYGHEANRFDQIHGTDFLYDPQSGDVVAKGVVHIDLAGNNSNPNLPHSDQAPPLEANNPIHLITSGLVFNQKSGDASTSERIEFHLAQASGWAVGAHYAAKRNELVLDKDVHISITTPNPTEITASHGLMSKEPRGAVLYDAHITRENNIINAAQAILCLRPDDSIDRVVGSGGVDSTTTGPTTIHIRAPEGVFYLAGHDNELQRGDLAGGASFDTQGVSAMFGSADTVHLDFATQNRLEKTHAQGHVKIIQPPKPGSTSQPQVKTGNNPDLGMHAQTVELDADALDLWLVNGNQLVRGETSEKAQIVLTPQKPHSSPQQKAESSKNRQPVQRTLASAEAGGGEHTVITAAKFYAGFKDNRLDSLIGVPDARVVSYTPGEPDRVSTSRTIEVSFLPAGGIAQVVQRDSFHYLEHLPNRTDRIGWAQLAVYSPATDTLTLTGQPRVVEGGMTTTARVVRMEHQSGEAFAEGDVKTTYSDVQPQPNGALLAGGEPIHVTARSMTAQHATNMARYTGDARLWQATSIVQAPVIDFDRDKRTVIASTSSEKAPSPEARAEPDTRHVSTVLMERDKTGKLSPVNVTSSRLTYADNQRLAQFEGGVVARGVDGTLTAKHVDVYLKPAMATPRPTRSSGPPAQGSQVDKMIATGDVVLQQPTRRGTGQRLVYTTARDEYVLTGGQPTIFDAEQGTVTGASLTFYNRDDRVLVEGSENARSITHTRAPK